MTCMGGHVHGMVHMRGQRTAYLFSSSPFSERLHVMCLLHPLGHQPALTSSIFK